MKILSLDFAEKECKCYGEESIIEEWYKNFVVEHREKMNISFKKVKGHAKEYFNEMADILANKALKAERMKRTQKPMFFSLGDKFQEALAKVN